MMHRAWSSIVEVPYCFSRSYVKLQGHTALKIVEFDPNWAFPDCNSSLNSPMAMKCCTKLETAKERCPIIFQGHPSNFKVSRYKTSPILTQIGRFRTIGRSQLSNPSDLPCYIYCLVFAYRCIIYLPFLYIYVCLSSTLPEIDPDTAYVVCISESLGFPYMVSVFPCFPYMVSICPYFLIWYYSPLFWVWRCYGLLWTLHCHKKRYCDVTMIWLLLFYGIRADVSETPDIALTTRMHGDYRPSIDRFFVGFNAISYAFLRNSPIYIEGRNCSFSTVPVLFTKCSGFRPSDTLSSWWCGWRRQARVGKSNSLVNHWIYNFKASTQYSYCIYIYCIYI